MLRVTTWSRRAGFAVAAALLATVPGTAISQDRYPDRTIKIVVPVPPGPILDVLPRIVGEKLAARWRQPVVIENRPGAAQNLGAEIVAKSDPDGYTLLAAPAGPLVISQHFYSKLRFDPTAFVPVTVMATVPYTLVVNPKIPASSLGELVALAKANPGRLTFATPGVGSPPHLAGEMLQTLAGIRMVHIPYQGMAPATTDLLAGHVDLMFDNLANTAPHIKSGKLKLLAVGEHERIPEFPEVAAVAESYPGFFISGWYAIVAPPKTPSAIADKLSTAIAESLKLPDVATRLQGYSAIPVASSPSDTAAFFNAESERWREVIQTNGIKAE